MTWLQLRLDIARPNVAELEDLLLEAGAVAVTLEDNADQPLLEPGAPYRTLSGGHKDGPYIAGTP